MQIGNYARDVATGAPFTTGNATIKDNSGATIASPALNGTTGRWEYIANGQPGIVSQTYVAAGQTKIVNGDAFGQAGDWCESELSRILKLFGDGVIDGLAMSAPGGMAVQVGTGNALNLGVLHPIYTAENVTIGSAHASLTRIDRVVSRLTRTGTFAGKVVLAVVAGTPSGSPVEPALTNDANTWEVEIARVTVPGAASSIVLGNISTATRSIATGPVADGSVTTAKITDAAVTTVKLADDVVTLAKLADSALVFGPLPGLVASRWYNAQGLLGGLIEAITIAQNTIYATPVFIPRTTTLIGLGTYRVGGSSSSATARLGLYRCGTNGLPDALHTDGGTVAINAGLTSGEVVVSAAVDPGWYWASVCAGSFTGTITLYGMNAATTGTSLIRALLGEAAMASVGVTNEWAVSGSFSGTGSLPGTFPTPTILSSCPLGMIKTSGT